MNIYDALKQVDGKKAEYFKWKHDLRFKRNLPKKTQEEFLRFIDRKTLDGFIKWEKSEEYKALLLLMLGTQTAHDLHEVYQAVLEKAKQGEDVNNFIKLHKEINTSSKVAQQIFKVSPK
ncbi:hypothetical protein A2U94_19645 [Bacillus sp. VT 712]|uniref:hypothetical protein n=1 Tax=Bacillus sp. VT 712 TaxID=1848047 RepID=UPI0007A44303|nr:hypothetical protein [Bacillus sp. VT 712]KZB89799.1 hypothetical protein A2U94_19645 [Bacillus sp. VT 712]